MNNHTKLLLSASITAILIGCVSTDDVIQESRQTEQPQTASPAKVKTSALKKEAKEGDAALAGAELVMEEEAFYDASHAPHPANLLANQQRSREKYAPVEYNKFKQVSEDSLSTFSIDVDTASYTNARRYIENGQLPPVASVRTEEFINYFSYNYKASDNPNKPFNLNYEIAPSPWNADAHYIHIGLKAYEAPKQELPPSNLVFLVDVSGSMASDDKLGLVKKSLNLLVKQMDEDDSIALVVYAGAAGVVLPPTPANKRSEILAALERLQAGGSTHGSAGINLAYQVAQEAFIKGGNNRVIIATDGDFNVGVSGIDELKRLIEVKRKSGINLTTVGVGTGNYNDHLMETLSNAGDGNAVYIDNLKEAQKAFVNEIQSTLHVVAKDVKIQVEFNPDMVESYRLVGYENRILEHKDFNDDKKDAGDIGSGHTVTAIYEVQFSHTDNRMVDPLRYQKKQKERKIQNLPEEVGFVKVRYKMPDSSKSMLTSFPMMTSNISNSLNKASEDFRFSAAVVGFAEHLRNLNASTYDEVISLAKASKGDDEFGYRSDFLNLVRMAKSIEK